MDNNVEVPAELVIQQLQQRLAALELENAILQARIVLSNNGLVTMPEGEGPE